jgi:cell division protein FtsA
MHSNNPNLILGLDIGSSTISAAICEIDAAQSLNLRGLGSSITSGIKRGMIEDAEELQRAIERAVLRAEQNSGGRASKLLTTIPLAGVQFVHHNAFIISSSETGKITQEDKENGLKRARSIHKSQDQTIMHVIPQTYKVDGSTQQNPVDQKGANLEIQTHIVLCNEHNLSALSQALKHLAIPVNGIVFDALASGQALLSFKEKQEGAILIDIGGRFTKVSLFQNQILQEGTVIPIGGETITSDISKCLSVSIPEAERLKIGHADLILSRVNPTTNLTITTQTGQRSEINRSQLCRIVEARVAELFSLIKKQNPAIFKQDLPIILAGGASNLKGIMEYLKLHSNARLRTGLPDQLSATLQNQEYATAVGIIMYGLKNNVISYKEEPSGNLTSKFKKFFFG